MKAPVKWAWAGTGAEGFFEMVVCLFFYYTLWIFTCYICANPQVPDSSVLLCVHVWMIAVYNWKPCFLIWGVHALLGGLSVGRGTVCSDKSQPSAQRCAALLAGQSIHSGNQKQGLRKWVLSEVTSQWGSTCSRSGKARTRTMGLWEYAESCWGGPRVQRTGVLPYLRLEVAHVQQGVSVCKMVGERWNRWGGRSGGCWVLLLDESSRALGDVTVRLWPRSVFSQKPLKAHGEWRDETEEWGLSLSPPSLSHSFSPCRGTCQGHIYRKGC